MSRELARAQRTEPVGVKCPACGKHFSLDEAVLGGVREELARELGAEFQQRERDMAAQQEALRKQDAALKKERADLEDLVEGKVAERTRVQLQEIRAQEAKKAA